MEMLLSFVLLSLLVSPVLSLECFVCSSSASNEECIIKNTTQVCQAPMDTCMTIIKISGAEKAIVKQCASWATCSGAASSSSVDSNGSKVNCCNSYSLCNLNGAESIRIHTTLLLLAVGALLLLSH